MAQGPYSYEKIADPEVKGGPTPGYHFRVRDGDDSRIATCYLEENAALVARALNHYEGRRSGGPQG